MIPLAFACFSFLAWFLKFDAVEEFPDNSSGLLIWYLVPPTARFLIQSSGFLIRAGCIFFVWHMPTVLSRGSRVLLSGG
jgi:hypothetical protein